MSGTSLAQCKEAIVAANEDTQGLVEDFTSLPGGRMTFLPNLEMQCHSSEVSPITG